jgi:hypothetical protein
MWLTIRPTHTDWMAMFVAPFSAEVGRGRVCGWTVSSPVERTVVHAVGPGVSSGWALMAASSLEPAACCQMAGGQPLAAQAAVVVGAAFQARPRPAPSFGVATARGDRIELESLVAQADAALYAAKRAGRNRVERYGAPVPRSDAL